MPIDPNIPLSGNQMAPVQLPDVNAMMQTRTAGLENMYNIGRQQQQDAAAAQKAQADAAVNALAPAYATAFKGGGTKEAVTAAYNMLPPEMQAGVKDQIDKLMAMPSDDLRLAALESSMAGSDIGRALLNRIPTEIQRLNAAVQQGQLDVSRRRLAMEESQAGVPKPLTEYEAGQLGLREREVKLREDEAAAKAAAGEAGDMDPKVKVKLEQAYPKASRGLQSAVTGLDQDIADVEKLVADPGLKSISGLVGSSTPNISAEARRAQALYDKILAGAGFGALQAMRDASPTGGALGNVSNQEGQKLEKSVAAFAQSQDYGDLKKALNDYLFDLKVAKENVVSTFDETYGYRGPNPSADIVTGVQERRARLQPQTTAPGASSLPAGVVVRKNP